MLLVKALVELNKYQSDNEAPLIEAVVMSRNSPEIGLKMLQNIRNKQLELQCDKLALITKRELRF